MKIKNEEIYISSPPEVLKKLSSAFPLHFLLESKQVSLFSGRFSLLGIDPILKISGKNEIFSVDLIHPRGNIFFNQLGGATDTNRLSIRIPKESGFFEESQRSKKANIAQGIRRILEKFSVHEKTFLGLYGAFSYDFIRLFEDLGDSLPDSEVSDFTLFLYDTFFFFDHIKEQTSLILYRQTDQELQMDSVHIQKLLKEPTVLDVNYQISKNHFAFSKEEFEKMVLIGKQYITEGEFVQVVFSNIFKSQFSGNPFGLYLKYREKNPSPYLFYFQFGDEQLVGASPEMMVRFEEGLVHLRPIAGTIKRGNDPIEDHDHMLELLTSEKERAELEMLIDLGRSDLSRICEPGITMSDYRFVEKYSRVMHTVAHLTGKLRKEYIGLDALISCLNAGTVTGAPKVAAMRAIEKHEKERRQYYGGAIGQLTFSGEVDTAIIIRTAHIRNGKLRYQSGAGIVYDSDPEKEYFETLSKAQAFEETLSSL